MKVCWFSTGISSFAACYLAKDVDEIIYTHVPNQHPDSLRFLHDCEKLLGRKITVIQSDEYRDVDDVIEKTRFGIGQMLVSKVLQDWILVSQ